MPAQESTTRGVKGKNRRRREGLTGNQKTRLLSIIRKLQRANRCLRRVASSDDLTCALNRRYLPDVLKAALIRAKVSGSVSLCLFDVDHFKTYNDSYGHAAGDETLRRIARAVQNNLRSSTDKLFRCGGDEFCILFSAQTPLHAQRLVERLRLAILHANESYRHANGDTLTVSFGVVWQGGDSSRFLTPAELYREADRMLYQAKDAGRGEIRQVVIDDAAPGGPVDQTGSGRCPAPFVPMAFATESLHRLQDRMVKKLARRTAEFNV